MVMVMNKRLVLAAVLALAGNNHASAFVPASIVTKTTTGAARNAFAMTMTASEVNTIDVSIDYDSAARLAYSKWCTKFDKEGSEDKFSTFKANYEAVTVANVSAAKKARDEGTDRPKDLELNEYGDITEEEYNSIMSGGSGSSDAPALLEDVATESGNISLKSAMEASAVQSAASDSLSEAADALAEEEEKLAAKLSMDSVEELEQAFDAMEGIDVDGGALDKSSDAQGAEKGALETASNALSEASQALTEEEEKLAAKLGMDSVKELEQALDAIEGIKVAGGEKTEKTSSDNDVQETRVRSRYMGWCKQYGKDPDEKRFTTFSSNFLAMEAYSQDKGREMLLNKYADCTEEEYREITNTSPPVIEIPAPAPVEEPNAETKTSEPMEEEKQDEKKIEKKSETNAAVKEEKKPVAEKKAAAPAKKPAPKKPASKPEPILSLEEQAIADARAAAEKEAKFVASRRALDEAASKIELQKAKKALAQQKAQATAVKSQLEVSKPEPVKKIPANPFESIFALKAGANKAATAPEEKVSKSIAKATPPNPAAISFDLGSFFGGSSQSKSTPKAKLGKVTPALKAATNKKTEPKKQTPPSKNIDLGSFFGAKQSAKKPAYKAPVPPPAPSAKKAVPKRSPALSLFGGVSKPSAKPKVAPAPRVAAKKISAKPAATRAVSKRSGGTFSLFRGSSPKPVAKKTSPAPAPVAKTAPRQFSFFGSSPSSPKHLAKSAAIPAKKAVAKNKTRSPVKPTPPKAASKGIDTFSVFSGMPPKKTIAKKASPTPAPVPAVKNPALKQQFSFFGSIPPPKAKKAAVPAPVTRKSTPKPAAAATVAKKGSGSFSLFRSSPAPKPKKVAAPPSPALTKKSPTFNLFGGTTPQKEGTSPGVPPKNSPPAKKASSAFGGFPFGGSRLSSKPTAAKKAVPGIPIVGNFKQNPDGSITGIVRNAKNFRNGTRITTSPVKKGAKPGDLVVTSSGSKYQLE